MEEEDYVHTFFEFRKAFFMSARGGGHTAKKAKASGESCSGSRVFLVREGKKWGRGLGHHRSTVQVAMGHRGDVTRTWTRIYSQCDTIASAFVFFSCFLIWFLVRRLGLEAVGCRDLRIEQMRRHD